MDGKSQRKLKQQCMIMRGKKTHHVLSLLPRITSLRHFHEWNFTVTWNMCMPKKGEKKGHFSSTVLLFKCF